MLGGPGLGHRPPLRYSKALFMFSEVLLLIVFSICSPRARISFGSGSPTRPSPTPFCASSCLATLDLGVWGWGTHADLQLEGCALVQLLVRLTGNLCQCGLLPTSSPKFYTAGPVRAQNPG